MSVSTKQVGNRLKLVATSELKPGAIVFNCIGDVTRAPLVGNVPVTSAFGTNFYIDGRRYSSITSDQFIPAWLLPVATQKEIETWPANTVVLELRKHTLNYTYKYAHFLRTLTVTPTVTIYSLRVPPQASGKKDVLLMRPPFPDVVAATVGPKGPDNSRKPKGDSSWKLARHLWK